MEHKSMWISPLINWSNVYIGLLNMVHRWSKLWANYTWTHLAFMVAKTMEAEMHIGDRIGIYDGLAVYRASSWIGKGPVKLTDALGKRIASHIMTKEIEQIWQSEIHMWSWHVRGRNIREWMSIGSMKYAWTSDCTYMIRINIRNPYTPAQQTDYKLKRQKNKQVLHSKIIQPGTVTSKGM